MPRNPRIKLESVHFNFDKGQVRFYPPHKKEAGFYGSVSVDVFAAGQEVRRKIPAGTRFTKANAKRLLLQAIQLLSK